MDTRNINDMLMTQENKANTTERGTHVIQHVYSISEAKGRREELSAYISSGVGAPGELFNAFLGCLRNVLSILLEKEADMPRMRLVGLLLIGMKKRRPLPHCLPFLETFLWGREASFENSHPFPTDLFSRDVTFSPAIRIPTPYHRASHLTSLIRLSHKMLIPRGGKSEFPKGEGIGSLRFLLESS